MYSSPITIPADRGGSAGMRPVPPGQDEQDDDTEAPEATVPPAEAERPKSLLDRLLEAICTPGESNYDNP